MSGRDEQVVLVRGADGLVRAMSRDTGRVVAVFEPQRHDPDDALGPFRIALAVATVVLVGFTAIYLGAHILAAHFRSLTP